MGDKINVCLVSEKVKNEEEKKEENKLYCKV